MNQISLIQILLGKFNMGFFRSPDMLTIYTEILKNKNTVISIEHEPGYYIITLTNKCGTGDTLVIPLFEQENVEQGIKK